MDRPVKNATEFFRSVVDEVVKEDARNKNNLGKILLCAMRRHPKDTVLQIDAATDERDTVGEVLERSIRTAQALRRMGVGVGDVVMGMGKNHLDVVIPLYASTFVGAAFMGIDSLLKKNEVLRLLERVHPKIIFCDTANLAILPELVFQRGIKVVTFDKDSDGQHERFREFIQKHREDESIEEFKAAIFEPSEISASLCTTSGTTGLPKIVDLTHENITPMMSIIWSSGIADFETLTSMLVCLAPIYWYSAFVIHIQCALFLAPKVQTSGQFSPQHVYHIINKYEPSWIAMTPALALMLLKQPEAIQWNSFYTFAMTGAALTEGLIDTLNNLIGRPAAVNGYGLTEAAGRVFYGAEKTPGSLGVPLPNMKIKLVNPYTGEEVIHPHKGGEVQENVKGELWIKGPSVCRGYYNDPESTKEAFTEDGWFKTGDIVYRNEKNHFYFVDRLKSMMNVAINGIMYHLSPVEIESEIKVLPGVLDVAVIGWKTENDMERPLAVVVKKPGHDITENDIIRHIEAKMSRSRHLTGGVRFVDALPLKTVGKIDRRQLDEIVNKSSKK